MPSLFSILQSSAPTPLRDRLRLVLTLSLPAVLAQLTSIAMEYIDAAMVGSLGANASASIGLMATTIWLIYGLGGAIGSGFSVQVAQAVGARDAPRTTRLVHGGLRAVLLASLAIGLLAALVARPLPCWLRADPAIRADASRYFLIFACSQPIVMVTYFALGLLQSAGDIRRASVISALMCLFDVIFNALCIFPARIWRLGPLALPMPGLGLGVAGAAFGTLLATATGGLLALVYTLRRAPALRPVPGAPRRLLPSDARMAVRIALPIACESAALASASVLVTAIIAPLGPTALAAHSFAITAEALCYMSAFGFSSAATTLVGQSIGAERPPLARSFAWLTTGGGVLAVSSVALLLYVLAPLLFRFFTPDAAVRDLGVLILRIEMFAEPLFAASIVANGALRGAGDTFFPALINLVSVWVVRLTLTFLLVQRYGLVGAWMAMAAELCLRGILYLLWLTRQRFRPLRA